MSSSSRHAFPSTALFDTAPLAACRRESDQPVFKRLTTLNGTKTVPTTSDSRGKRAFHTRNRSLRQAASIRTPCSVRHGPCGILADGTRTYQR
jgi:hypothetical protein